MDEKLYSVRGELEGKFTKKDLIKLSKENDLIVEVLESNFISESLEHYEVDYYFNKRDRSGYVTHLIKRADKKFYCKGYNT